VQVTALRLLTKALRPPAGQVARFCPMSTIRLSPSLQSIWSPNSGGERGPCGRVSNHRPGAAGFSWTAKASSRSKTPTLHSLIGGATARPFKNSPQRASISSFSLRIAPGAVLGSGWLVGGLERVYEIGRLPIATRASALGTTPSSRCSSFIQAYATYETLMGSSRASCFRHVDAFLQRRLEALGLAEARRALFRAERPFTLAEPFFSASAHESWRSPRRFSRAELPAEVASRFCRKSRFSWAPDGKRLPRPG